MPPESKNLLLQSRYQHQPKISPLTERVLQTAILRIWERHNGCRICYWLMMILSALSLRAYALNALHTTRCLSRPQISRLLQETIAHWKSAVFTQLISFHAVLETHPRESCKMDIDRILCRLRSLCCTILATAHRTPTD